MSGFDTILILRPNHKYGITSTNTMYYANSTNFLILTHNHDIDFLHVELTAEKAPKKQRTPLLLEEQGSPERQQWRRGRDLNPG